MGARFSASTRLGPGAAGTRRRRAIRAGRSWSSGHSRRIGGVRTVTAWSPIDGRDGRCGPASRSPPPDGAPRSRFARLARHSQPETMGDRRALRGRGRALVVREMQGPPVYVGVAPVPQGGANVCLVRPAAGRSALRVPALLLAAELDRDPGLRDRFSRAWLIQPSSSSPRLSMFPMPL